jgi:SH3-like domain-containing protein
MHTRTAQGIRGFWALVLLLLAGIWLAPRSADARVERFVRVKVDVANLRAKPSRQAELVRQAYENEPLRVVASSGQWLQVQDVADESAWINAELTDGRSAVVVVRDLVNVREQPGTGFTIVFTAERGVNLLVLERSGRWLRVRHDVGEGWLHDSLVWGPP